MSELLNISDQLDGYLGENIGIIKKMQKETGLTLEQTIKCAEIATQEMIADCLFHINMSLQSAGEEISTLDCSNELENIAEEISALNCNNELERIVDSIDRI